jgi:hypothetical protein
MVKQSMQHFAKNFSDIFGGLLQPADLDWADHFNFGNASRAARRGLQPTPG